MRKLLFATAATAALVAAVPASAQVYFGAGPYGGSVEFGGSRDGWRDRDGCATTIVVGIATGAEHMLTIARWSGSGS